MLSIWPPRGKGSGLSHHPTGATTGAKASQSEYSSRHPGLSVPSGLSLVEGASGPKGRARGREELLLSEEIFN